MFKTAIAFMAFVASAQTYAHQEECESHLAVQEIEVKTISSLTLAGEPSTTVNFVRNGADDHLALIDKETGKVTLVEFSGAENGKVVSSQFLGRTEGPLKNSQILNFNEAPVIAGVKTTTKSLEVQIGTTGLMMPELPFVRQWKLIAVGSELYLVVTTNNSLIVLKKNGQGFQMTAELKNQALSTSLDVHADGEDLFIVTKGDLRVHIAKYSQGRLAMVKQVVQLGGEIYSAMSENGLVFAAVDRLDRTVNFYSLNGDKRAVTSPFSLEIGRAGWLNLGDGKTVFVLNTGDRTISHLLMFSGENFARVDEKITPHLSNLKGAVDNLSSLGFKDRDYIVFSQGRNEVRLVNHVDENLITVELDLTIRQVTEPYRLADGRIVIAVVSSNSKKAKVDVIQVGQ